MSSTAKAVLVAVVWFILGGGVGLVTATLMMLGSLGGLNTPPKWWGSVVVFGFIAVPPILTFGWIPVVVQLKREKPALKLALIVLGVSVSIWLATLIAWDTGRPH